MLKKIEKVSATYREDTFSINIGYRMVTSSCGNFRSDGAGRTGK